LKSLQRRKVAFLEASTADALKSPSERIDSVQWNVDGYEPTEEIWQTLNGLSSPKHLKIVLDKLLEFGHHFEFVDHFQDFVQPIPVR
jgi:hypothetical protein